MRLLIATCSATYTGRSVAELPEATRVVVHRGDGGVLLLAETGQVKPLMWMPAPCSVRVQAPGEQTPGGQADCGGAPGERPAEVWTVTHAKTGEKLVVTVHQVHAELSHDLGAEPGLRRDDTEAHLQDLLAANPAMFGEGFTVLRAEAPTPVGPVDFLCRDAAGATVAVEVKRQVADLAPVEQICRYVDFLDRDPLLRPVTGMLVATSFAPQAAVLAADRGIRCVTVDLAQLRAADPDRLTLF